MLTHTFAKGKCVEQHRLHRVKVLTHTTHICQRQMCLPAPECAHSHICKRKMCLPTPASAPGYINELKILKKIYA